MIMIYYIDGMESIINGINNSSSKTQEMEELATVLTNLKNYINNELFNLDGTPNETEIQNIQNNVNRILMEYLMNTGTILLVRIIRI